MPFKTSFPRFTVIICLIWLWSCSENEVREQNNSQQDTSKSQITLIDSGFIDFYESFLPDTSFQLSRVRFPLEGSYTTYDSSDSWTADQWPYLSCDLRRAECQSDSVILDQDHESVFFGTYCLDCGFSFEMQFEKVEGTWMLTYRQENNF